MTAAPRARRWIALAAAAAIVAHAFGMGLLGPRMAESAALQIAAELAKPPAVEDCPFHAAVAADLARAGHGAAAIGEDAGHDTADEGKARHEKHPPSCEACPLGQSGMALAPPPVVPIATALVGLESAAPAVRRLVVEAWPHRTPPARAPPGRATA